MPANFVLDIYMSILIPLVPAALIVILRVYARRIKNLTLWWDDWLAFLSLVRQFQSHCYGSNKKASRADENYCIDWMHHLRCLHIIR